jgi:hypothetical protein
LEDWDLIIPLLQSNTSLQNLHLIVRLQDNRVVSALAQYLGAASHVSLSKFTLYTYESLSEAAFVSLCDGIARSQLRKLTLRNRVANVAYVETAAESLARAIAESPLEKVSIYSSPLLCSAISFAQPVRNLDFAINMGTVGRYTRMVINRKWKPLLSANTIPSALWPHILEKAHASPETSHGPAGILFAILREKPDLVR